MFKFYLINNSLDYNAQKLYIFKKNKIKVVRKGCAENAACKTLKLKYSAKKKIKIFS